jgi:hypothetical protein
MLCKLLVVTLKSVANRGVVLGALRQPNPCPKHLFVASNLYS